ncbi:hypothetical protein M9X92_009088 [Pyricularia oryzae]|nr:hypothetical protein M9X92_009088 [Pyricularia oryzae]
MPPQPPRLKPPIKTFPDTNFPQRPNATTLPTPSEGRALNPKPGSQCRPPPLETQTWACRQLSGKKIPSHPRDLWLTIAGLALAELQQLSVCEQLGAMVKVWRCLIPDTGRYYRPVNKILRLHPALAGPFHEQNAVQEFQNGCGVKLDSSLMVAFFTRANLHPLNIILPDNIPTTGSFCKGRLHVRTYSASFSDDKGPSDQSIQKYSRSLVLAGCG